MLTPPTRAHHRRADDWHRSDGGLWLPGAADVPRVAGDPMRGAGMVRRGMGMGFEPAGCCCEETAEGCGDYGPFAYDYSNQAWLVEIDGVENGSVDCSAVNNSFLLETTSAANLAPPSCFVQKGEPEYTFPGLRMANLRFQLRGKEGRRDILLSIGVGDAYWNTWFQLIENTITQFSNTDGSSWEVPPLSSTGCNLSAATCKVTIVDL